MISNNLKLVVALMNAGKEEIEKAIDLGFGEEYLQHPRAIKIWRCIENANMREDEVSVVQVYSEFVHDKETHDEFCKTVFQVEAHITESDSIEKMLEDAMDDDCEEKFEQPFVWPTNEGFKPTVMRRRR